MEANFLKIKTAPYKSLLDIVREPVFDISLWIENPENKEVDKLEATLRISVHKYTWETKEVVHNDSITLTGKTSRILGRDYIVMLSKGEGGCEIAINAPANLAYAILKDLSSVVNIDRKKLEEVCPLSHYALQQEVYLWN
ncbi:MAG: hypothetical protein J7K73_02520 [Nanoarchaeota archaeon]|nr:hypothetical protein [Nanoarchaeota archaeon]